MKLRLPELSENPEGKVVEVPSSVPPVQSAVGLYPVAIERQDPPLIVYEREDVSTSY